jgi:hypothetical protein
MRWFISWITGAASIPETPALQVGARHGKSEENPIRLALKFTALVFSSICGKIDSIGEVAGFSGDVRVLPEEPMILLDLPARITPDDPQNYNTVGTFVGTLTLPLQNAA